MKLKIIKILCLGVFIFITIQVKSQIAQPTIWFSFDNTLNSSYGSATSSGSNYNFSDLNRFNESSKAVHFPTTHTTGHLLTSSSKLFGYTTGNLPDNFTISCWVYVDPSDTQVRKIFYSDSDDSRFGLLHKGKDIFLRRVPSSNTTRFDYRFWAPASFDAGTGWYHVIFVMGKRSSDNAKYCKLYIGKKPGYVKYDATGPRVITTTTDPLAPDFGGAYAFLGQQSFMNTTTQWGFGNGDSNDPVHTTNIAAVRRMDDFAVWGIALTDAQAKALYDCQKTSAANSCWSSSLVDNPVALVVGSSATTEIANIGLTVYPNPTSGDLKVQITEAGAAEAQIRVLDLSGRMLYAQTSALDAGYTEVVLPDFKTKVGGNSGLYLLEVITAQQRHVVKVAVK